MRIFLTSLVMIVTSSLSERSYAWRGKDKKDNRLLWLLNPIGKTHVVAPLASRSGLHFALALLFYLSILLLLSILIARTCTHHVGNP